MVDLNSKFDAVRKIVVITCRLLSDAHRYILRCLSTHEGVHHYTIFTSISEVLILDYWFWLWLAHHFVVFIFRLSSSLSHTFCIVFIIFHYASGADFLIGVSLIN